MPPTLSGSLKVTRECGEAWGLCGLLTRGLSGGEDAHLAPGHTGHKRPDGRQEDRRMERHMDWKQQGKLNHRQADI